MNQSLPPAFETAQTTPDRRSLALPLRLTLVIVSVVVLVILVTGLISNVVIGREIETIASAQLAARGEALAGEIGMWLELRAKSLQQLAAQPDIISMSADQQQPVLRTLADIYTDTYLVSTTDVTGLNVARSDAADLIDYRDRLWFQRARTGQPLATQTLIGRTSNQPALVMAAPIRDDSQTIVGVAMFASELTAIRGLIVNAPLGQTGRAYLIDDQNLIVAHSDPALSDDELHSAESYPAVRALRAGGGSQLEFTDENKVAWRSYGVALPRGWAVVVQQHASELLAPLDAFRRSLTLGLVVGLIIIAALTWFSIRNTLRPIGQLTENATAIMAGDFTRVLPVQRSDEIGLLARTFNTMTGRLRDLIDSLEMRVELRTAQLRASAEVGRAASSILDPDDLLREIVRLIKERFNFYYVAVFLIDDTARRAVLHEAIGPGNVGQVLKSSGHSLDIDGRSMVGTAVVTRQPRIALDVGVEAVRFANPLLPDTRSEIALPLIVGNRVIGALDVQSTQAGAFDQTGAAVLQSMADQIAVALTNAQQYQREQERAERTTNLLEAALELSTQPDRTRLYERIVQLAMSLLDADGSGLWFQIDEQEIELAYTINAIGDQLGGRRMKVGEGLTGQVFATGLTLRVDDYTAWRGRSTTFADAPFHAALSVPLMWQGRLIGALAVTRSQPGRPFTVADENNAQLLATQAAAAIDNIRLREEQQRALDQLDAVNRRLTGESWQGIASQSPIHYEYRARKTPLARPGFTLQVPIELRGQPIGELTLQSEEARELSQDERELIDGVVQQMSLALENQRLASLAQQAARRDRAIAETADKIHQPTSLDAIMRVAVQELARITGASGVGVQLGFAPRSTNGQHDDTSRRQEIES